AIPRPRLLARSARELSCPSGLVARRRGDVLEGILRFLVRPGARLALAGAVQSEKLAWLNQQYLKAAPDARLARLVGDALERRGISADNGPPLERVIALLKERASTIA